MNSALMIHKPNRVTRVCFDTKLPPTDNPTLVRDTIQNHDGWLSLPVSGGDFALRCRMRKADVNLSHRTVSAEYSPGYLNVNAAGADLTGMLIHAERAIALLQLHLDPRPRAAPPSLCDIALNEVRVASYFAADETGAEAMLQRVRAHNIDCCACVSTERSKVTLTPHSRSAGNLTAVFSTALGDDYWRKSDERLAGENPQLAALARNGAVCVELIVPKKWMLAHAATHPRDWDAVDLTAFCMQEVRRFVSTDFDSYWRQNLSAGYASVEDRYLKKIASMQFALRDPSLRAQLLASDPNAMARWFVRDIGPYVADPELPSYFDRSNLVSYLDVLCKAATH